MISREDQANWRLRIEAAEKRYQAAKLRVGEAAIERLTLPVPDGNFAHSQAMQEEMRALWEYSVLLVEYCRILMD